MVVTFNCLFLEEREGKYECPFDGCTVTVNRINFYRLRKHYQERHDSSITLKLKPLRRKIKERFSTVTHKIEAPAIKPNVEEVPEDIMGLEAPANESNVEVSEKTKFQSSILVNGMNMGNVKDIKSKLDEFGVVLIKGFMDHRNSVLFDACHRMAAFLQVERTTRVVNKANPAYLDEITESIKAYPETSISGGIKMHSIPVDDIHKECEWLGFCEYPLDLLRDKLHLILGNQYFISGELAFLFSPQKTSKQVIHADNIKKNIYNGLLVLSDSAKPTIFLPKSKDDIAINEAPELHLSGPNRGKIIDDGIREKIMKKFHFMDEPLARIEGKMYPVSDALLTKGDLVLFEGDAVHRGDKCGKSDFKKLLFFSCRKDDSIPGNDIQVHAGLLASYFYGLFPETEEEKNKYFGMINRHIESIPNSKVPLSTLLGDEVKENYFKWIKDQKEKQKKKESYHIGH